MDRLVGASPIALRLLEGPAMAASAGLMIAKVRGRPVRGPDLAGEPDYAGAGRRRLWLVSAVVRDQGAGMRASTAAVPAERFTVVCAEMLHNVTVELLEPRGR